MNIRTMNTTDIAEVLHLGSGQKEFSTKSGSFWSKEQLERWCMSEEDILLVAEQDGKIIGFSLYATHPPTGKVTWENIYVGSSTRGKGVGAALIQEGHKLLRQKGYLYVVLQNNSKNQESFAEYLKQFGFKIGSKVLWIDQVLI